MKVVLTCCAFEIFKRLYQLISNSNSQFSLDVQRRLSSGKTCSYIPSFLFLTEFAVIKFCFSLFFFNAQEYTQQSKINPFLRHAQITQERGECSVSVGSILDSVRLPEAIQHPVCMRSMQNKIIYFIPSQQKLLLRSCCLQSKTKY